MQIISKVVQELRAQEKLIRRPLEFFRYERKNRGDSLCGCATPCQNGHVIPLLSSLTVRCASLCQGILSFGVASSDAHTPLPLSKQPQYGRSMIEMLEKVKQPLNVVLRRQAQVFRCCQSALAPRRNTENQVTEAPSGARRRKCAMAQSGRSMIEMLGVLAIIGVLSVGGIMGYSKAMFRYKINKTIEQITYIAGNIRTTFANQGNYEGLEVYCPNNNCIVKKAHIVPEDMWKDGEDWPQHSWDGEVDIGPEDKSFTDAWGKAFSIQYYNIPEEACIELITHDWKNAQVKLIKVYDNENTFFNAAEAYFVPPAKPDDAVKMCALSSNDSDDVNEIYFYFDVDTSANWWKGYIDDTAAALAGS